MKLTAFFDILHLADGNYPPFHTGQIANLSFQMFRLAIDKTREGDVQCFDHRSDAVYRFAGCVLRNYADRGYPSIAAIEADGFRFYINDASVASLGSGDTIAGEGLLGLDTYYWAEFLSVYEDAPNLFYNLEVKRIRKIYDPQSPVHLAAAPLKETEEDITDMDAYDETGQSVLQGSAYCIIDFDSEGHEEENIPRTFI
jgi:hypothetical protein